LISHLHKRTRHCKDKTKEQGGKLKKINRFPVYTGIETSSLAEQVAGNP